MTNSTEEKLKRPLLRIRREDQLGDFEGYLQDYSLDKKDLLLPNDLAEGGSLGRSVAFTQFLLTWARKSEFKCIRTFLKVGDTSSHTRFVNRVHGLAAVYFAKSVLAIDGVTDLRMDLLRAAKPRIDAMFNGDKHLTSRGPTIEFIFIQGAIKEFHGAVYSRAPYLTECLDKEAHGKTIRLQTELDEFAISCFETLGLFPYFKEYLRRIGNPFGSLLHEIIRNTAEHAYLQIDGTRFHQNLRCVKFTNHFHNSDRLNLMDASSKESTRIAEDYFKMCTDSLGNKMAKFSEISVFDSGSGFARTIANSHDTPPDREVGQVTKCFEKHQSSKAGGNSGLGLPRMMEIVYSLGGFLRIRTGSCEAFLASGCNLMASADPKDFVFGGLPKIEGTVVTIGIPVREE